MITFVRELFLAESKSQVYGHLHQFLQSAPSTASNLSRFLTFSNVLYYIDNNVKRIHFMALQYNNIMVMTVHAFGHIVVVYVYYWFL